MKNSTTPKYSKKQKRSRNSDRIFSGITIEECVILMIQKGRQEVTEGIELHYYEIMKMLNGNEN